MLLPGELIRNFNLLFIFSSHRHQKEIQLSLSVSAPWRNSSSIFRELSSCLYVFNSDEQETNGYSSEYIKCPVFPVPMYEVEYIMQNTKLLKVWQMFEQKLFYRSYGKILHKLLYFRKKIVKLNIMDFKIKFAILLALWDLSTYQPLLTVLLFYQL